jgi:hypothetical protein
MVMGCVPNGSFCEEFQQGKKRKNESDNPA